MNFAAKVWQNHEHLRYFWNICCLMINHSKYQYHVCLPENHKLIYHLCLQLSFAHAWLSYFLATHVVRKIIFVVFVWVCGLWFFSKKINSRLYLLLYLLFFLYTWHLEIFLCNLSFLHFAHFTEPLLSGNVLEISLPITCWISNYFYD